MARKAAEILRDQMLDAKGQELSEEPLPKGWTNSGPKQQGYRAKDTAPPGGRGDPAPAADDARPGRQAGEQTGAQIIRDFYRQRYRPDFRRGNVIHCADGREVLMQEATAVPTTALIDQLALATNAPRFTSGERSVKHDALPGFFNKWAKVAWGDLLDSLPDEDEAELGAESPAADEFRRMVRDAMLTQVTFGEVMRVGAAATQQERRSLIDWCSRFAAEGPWRDVRSLRCWCRSVMVQGGELRLQVMVRVELFSQLKADRRLCGMTPNVFSRRAARYKVGTSSRDARPHGVSAVRLADDFVAQLVEKIPDDEVAPEGR